MEEHEKELPKTSRCWRVVAELLRESGEWTRYQSPPMTQTQAAQIAVDWRVNPHAVRNVRVEGDRGEHARILDERRRA